MTITTLLSAALLTAQAAPPQNATFYQACAIRAELARDVLAADPRLADEGGRPGAEGAMDRFASALRGRERAALDAGYPKAEAFGWSRERVDEQHAAIGQSVEADASARLAKARLTADLVMALDTCAKGDPDALGQDAETLVTALEAMFAWSRR